MLDQRVFATVIVRLIGLAIVVYSGPATLGWLFDRIQELRAASTFNPRARTDLLTFLSYLAYVTTPMLGFYLLFGGRWCIAKVLRGLDPRRCPSCNYDVSATSADHCPECNSKILRRA